MSCTAYNGLFSGQPYLKKDKFFNFVVLKKGAFKLKENIIQNNIEKPLEYKFDIEF